jgi:hypothetical protein
MDLMISRAKIDEFWTWFASVALSLAANIENPSLLNELDCRIRALAPEVSWEIGPGVNEPWQFIISPNLDPRVRPKAQEFISLAPVLEGWEFYSARRPKDWNFKLEVKRLDGRAPVCVDASEWEFVLLQYPDGERELVLIGEGAALLEVDERWQVAAITLESILGEDALFDKINVFDLVEDLEPGFSEKKRSIRDLREFIQTI